LTRVLSAAVLLPIVLGIVWYLPPFVTWLLIGLVVLLAFAEYASLARCLSAGFPAWLSGVATLGVYATLALGLPLELVLAPAMLTIGLTAVARGDPREDVLRSVAVALLPALYLGVPLGLAATIRNGWGPAALMLPFLAIVVSDSAQYFGGRGFGRVPLAPAISPKKTVEGAICGVLSGVLLVPLLGRAIDPATGVLPYVLLGLLLSLVGMAGDLFESLLKRSAGVKDSGGIIPGHGGMLDRIDALLFAFPTYYLFLRLRLGS
jgi:phosphatidate cytidylyltransferase